MSITAKIELVVSAVETYTGPLASGTETLAKILRLSNLTGLQLAYAARATFKAAAANADFTIGSASASTSTAAAGAAQVETQTAAGAITGSGNLTVTVTAVGLTGSPLAVPVAVVNGDSAATWAGKVRTALAANAAIAAMFTVGGTGTAITLTRVIEAANDATLAIAVEAGTATNASLPLAASVNTTAGVAAAGTVFSGTTAGEIRGTAITPSNDIKLVMLVTSGEVTLAGPVAGQMGGNTFMLVGPTDADSVLFSDWEASDLSVTSVEAGTFDLLVFAES